MDHTESLYKPVEALARQTRTVERPLLSASVRRAKMIRVKMLVASMVLVSSITLAVGTSSAQTPGGNSKISSNVLHALTLQEGQQTAAEGRALASGLQELQVNIYLEEVPSGQACAAADLGCHHRAHGALPQARTGPNSPRPHCPGEPATIRHLHWTPQLCSPQPSGVRWD
jgi:hypothetical protein